MTSKLIRKPLKELGYGFIPNAYLPAGHDEYYIRERQRLTNASYRPLTETEITVLKAKGNYSPNWNDVWVTDSFLPEQIEQSKFYGRVRIGDMEASFLDYRDLQLPIGIYNSTVVSCDIGPYNAIHNVRYIAHFILGEEVILFNIKEMETSSNAKFGNGILKDGDPDNALIKLELCNENGGRSVRPFDGMQASDVYLWTRNRHDRTLQERFEAITAASFDTARGYYSSIGHRTVVKNSLTIKDVKIGTDAYIKGVNKLKNVTVNSLKEAYTQIGEGCELVNGIIGHGCRIFYGVKAVRFILASFSQLKYGARLINSYLGDNSTISCCEVLNSLIFPAHEQHHNNSFLCASLVMGQSNMAAGATVGSNHNSRAGDGEIIAGRGFWPGLCVSLKHNSLFASYTLIVKGDFMHELHIRMPFSMVGNDMTNDRLIVLPAYWFLYNMYALMRNNAKFLSRDQRSLKNQYFEYDVLAPDTINEIFTALRELEFATGTACESDLKDTDQRIRSGREILLDKSYDLSKVDILLEETENSKRKVIVKKAREAYLVYRRMVRYYAATQLKAYFETHDYAAFAEEHIHTDKHPVRSEFENVGGQLIRKTDLDQLLDDVREGKLTTWNTIHQRYHQLSSAYPTRKLAHALAALLELDGLSKTDLTVPFIQKLIDESVATKRWICQEIYRTRHKDYENPFRMLVYANREEMDEVIGPLDTNTFILQQEAEHLHYSETLPALGQSVVNR